MAIISKILESSPYPELFARFLYYRFVKGRFQTKQLHDYNKKKPHSGEEQLHASVIELNGLINHLRDLGIKEGDCLIVHSSTNAIKHMRATENELLDALIGLVGKDGTLALPAFPKEDLLKKDNGIKIYDPKRSVAWTGMLPNLLLRKKGSIRSPFPYNPLVALGKDAEELMRHNLDTDLAHDQKSCWGKCIEKHAKILFIGIPSYHSDTILHAIEDCHSEFLPDEWYETRHYYIKTIDGMVLKTVRIRAEKWAQHLAEKYTDQKYRKAGLIKKADYNGLSISFIDDCNVFLGKIWNDWTRYKFFYCLGK